MTLKSLAVCDKLLSKDDLSGGLRAETHSVRGLALRGLRRYEDALQALNEAIRIHPNDPNYWFNRSLIWMNLGRPDLAAADRAKSEEVRKQNAQR
jgi:tetratricopeptide (TPR) repeat protein